MKSNLIPSGNGVGVSILWFTFRSQSTPNA